MNLLLESEVREFASVLERAIQTEGGIQLARAAEADPMATYARLESLLQHLGIHDIAFQASLAPVLGGLELCRAAGRHLLPYPLPEVLAANGRDVDALAVVDEERPQITHARSVRRWSAVALDGRVHAVAGAAVPYGGLVSPFMGPITLDPSDEVAPEAPALWILLDAAYILGGLETATRLTIEHLNLRVQFGRALRDFQSLRFRTVDMSVAVSGVLELAYYAAWSFSTRPGSALTDALALRMAALDAARLVLPEAHQLHGAIGFTDEHDLSIVTRHLQSRLRTPWDLEGTIDHLAASVAQHGFDGLFTGEGASIP